MSFFIFACVTSVVAGFAIHVTKPLHIRYTAKGHSGSAVQSSHRLPTPRLGGLAILAGILSGVFLLDDHARQLGFWLLVSSIPVFLGGLGEDIGFDIKPATKNATKQVFDCLVLLQSHGVNTCIACHDVNILIRSHQFSKSYKIN